MIVDRHEKSQVSAILVVTLEKSYCHYVTIGRPGYFSGRRFDASFELIVNKDL